MDSIVATDRRCTPDRRTAVRSVRNSFQWLLSVYDRCAVGLERIFVDPVAIDRMISG